MCIGLYALSTSRPINKRFTCWNQYTNRRFENDGCRIDYCLVDETLLDFVEKGADSTLRCCNFDFSHGDAGGEDAAWHAATASGKFKGAGFDGTGIVAVSRQSLDTQFGSPHTGIIYTPPSYSDHVATSLLFGDSLRVCHEQILDEKETQTKKSQPQKSQMCIFSFFGKRELNTSAFEKKVNKDLPNITNNGENLQKSFFQRTSRSGAERAVTAKRKNTESSSASKKVKARNSQPKTQRDKLTKKTDSILNHFSKH